MDWNNVKLAHERDQIPGTLKSSPKNRRLVAKPFAKLRKDPSPSSHNTDEVLELIQNKITNAEFSPTRDDGQIALHKRRAVVDGYKKLLRGLDATHFLTFMPGRFVRPEILAANIIKFCCRVERKSLGKKWSKCTKDRIRLVAFLEKPDITPHCHGFARIPKVTWKVLEKSGPEIWKKLMPAGNFVPLLIYNEEKVLGYTTKDLHHYRSPENVVIYKPITPKK